MLRLAKILFSLSATNFSRIFYDTTISTEVIKQLVLDLINICHTVIMLVEIQTLTV